MTALPEGAILLSADDAVEALVNGDHPEVISDGVEQDAALVELIRSGDVQTIRLVDGRLAFTREQTP